MWFVLFSIWFFFSWKLKENKYSKFGTNLDTLSSVEYDMKSTIISNEKAYYFLVLILGTWWRPWKSRGWKNQKGSRHQRTQWWNYKSRRQHPKVEQGKKVFPGMLNAHTEGLSMMLQIDVCPHGCFLWVSFCDTIDGPHNMLHLENIYLVKTATLCSLL